MGTNSKFAAGAVFLLYNSACAGAGAGYFSYNSAGFALARYKIPLALVLHYKIFAGAGATLTSGPAQFC